MLQDLSQLADGTHLSCDVCVIGAGAAGITVARALASSSLNVCLLESGGLDHEAWVANLGAGDNLGQAYYDLEDSRLRFFGGTTNIWGGRCVPMDPEDFEPRPWVPHSGWPIRIEDLAAGYQRAHSDLELGPPIAADEFWRRVDVSQPEPFRERFASSFWYFDEQAGRFGASQCHDVLNAGNVRVLTHASVTHLQARPNASGLDRVEIQAPGGKRASVGARTFVLAAGAIENARLLLMSRDVERDGIGNRHDLVGRFFMEHPHGRLGRVDSPAAYRIWATYQKHYPRQGVPMAPVLRPSPALQEQHGILNTAISFKLQPPPDGAQPIAKRAYQSLKHQLSPTRTNRALWHTYNRLRRTYLRHKGPVMRLAERRGSRRLYAMIRAEQAPNPASRVTLSQHKDAFGNPRADLHWRMSDLDKRTLRVLAETIAEGLHEHGLGTFIPEAWIDDADPAWPVDPTVGNHPIGGYHHMGTTRMAETPREGVTDRNCQVFGYSNLFIAGSSVFSTAGWANPTLTIVALAHRLAGHLAASLNNT
ncbi:MAG: FAD-dependent oxidoreductase [Pseudomonadales bacterium]